MLGYGHMMWGYGGLFMLLSWGILIIGSVLLIRWFTQQGKPSAPHQQESPIDILKKRYARGEIDKDEFEEKKEALFS